METHEKNFLKEKILEGRFLPVTDELFSFYDQYEALIDSQNPDDLAFLLCYKGETYFRIGDYDKALSRLTRCIRAPKSTSLLHLDAVAYNVMGMIYSLLGYEVIAYENYRHCEECCMTSNLTGDLIACRLNIGSLFHDMCDYEQALFFFLSALELIPKDNSAEYENIRILTLSYLGRIYCKKEDFSSADQIFQELSTSATEKNFYYVAANAFYVRYFYHTRDMIQYQLALDIILKHATSKENFFEFFEFYYDICEFLLSLDKPDVLRTLLNSMSNIVNDSSFSFLRYRIESLEVKYAKKYDTPENYLESCSHFIESQKALKEFQIPVVQHSMEHVELIHKTRQDSNRLEEKSRLDQMTGLFNKYTIEFLIQEKLKGNPEQSLAILLVDMDYFKQINGKLGHLTGDSIIRDTASIIQNFFTENALCGRIGGDEFLICVSDFPDRTAILLQAELLRQEICRQTSKRNLPLPTDASIGLAFASPTCSDFTTLFRKADDALYHAKRSGRNKVIAAD